MDVNNKNYVGELWQYFHELYHGVFEKLDGCHRESDLIGNTLIKDRLNKVENFKMMSIYEIEEIRFFYRMIDSFDNKNLELFQKFSELYMEDFKDAYISMLRDIGFPDCEIDCAELNI